MTTLQTQPSKLAPGAIAAASWTVHAPAQAGRLGALDAIRGLAIVVMLVVMNPGPAHLLPDQLHHPSWHGLTFADLFFPLFLFAIGVSMTLSRRAHDLRYVLRRAGLLFVVGLGLMALKYQTFWVTGVLQHIAIAYVVAYAIVRAPRRWQLPLGVGLFAAIWVAYVLWAWGQDPWGRSGTLAHAVDEALIGRFSTEGSVQSIMSTVAVLAGAFTGYLIGAVPDRRRLAQRLAVRAAAFIGLGLLIALWVPINKRLWSPSFAVLTIGTSLAWTALAVWLADVRGARRSVAPFVHLGANPISIYILFFASLMLLRNYADGLTPEFAVAGSAAVGAAVYAAGWTALWWLFAYALYRRRIFIKI